MAYTDPSVQAVQAAQAAHAAQVAHAAYQAQAAAMHAQAQAASAVARMGGMGGGMGGGILGMYDPPEVALRVQHKAFYTLYCFFAVQTTVGWFSPFFSFCFWSVFSFRCPETRHTYCGLVFGAL